MGFVYLFVFVNKPAFSQEEFSTRCIYINNTRKRLKTKAKTHTPKIGGRNQNKEKIIKDEKNKKHFIQVYI